MAKFKICPHCGSQNTPNMLECIACGEDLSQVSLTDEATLAEEKKRETQKTQAAPVRVCEQCGCENPANARKCKQCGEDISDVVPHTAEDRNALRICLIGMDGMCDYQVPEGETLIGKEHAMQDLLAGKAYVSRMHGRLHRESGKLFYENLSHSNFTYINNGKTVSGRVELKDGDVIGLGGNEVDGKRQENAAYFTVRITQEAP